MLENIPPVRATELNIFGHEIFVQTVNSLYYLFKNIEIHKLSKIYLKNM